jgi:hypothetical protein
VRTEAAASRSGHATCHGVRGRYYVLAVLPGAVRRRDGRPLHRGDELAAIVRHRCRSPEGGCSLPAGLGRQITRRECDTLNITVVATVMLQYLCKLKFKSFLQNIIYKPSPITTLKGTLNFCIQVSQSKFIHIHEDLVKLEFKELMRFFPKGLNPFKIQTRFK